MAYWAIEASAYAFDSREDAMAFADKLHDAFCAMPEARGYGFSTKVVEEADDPLPAPASGE